MPEAKSPIRANAEKASGPAGTLGGGMPYDPVNGVPIAPGYPKGHYSEPAPGQPLVPALPHKVPFIPTGIK